MRVLIALALLVPIAAQAAPVSGDWNGEFSAKSSSANPRCASMRVSVSVDAQGNGTFELAPMNTTTRVPGTFKLNADGTFETEAHTPVGRMPVTGALTADGGRFDYDNPAGCAYGGKLGRK